MSRMHLASLDLWSLIIGQDETIAHYAGYTEEELLPCFQLMVEYLHGPVKHDAFFKKYAHKKFMKGNHPPALILFDLILTWDSLDGYTKLGKG